MFCVYVLESLKDKKFYIGQTNHLESRFKCHEEGKVRSTKNRRPLKLVYAEQFDSRAEAMRREKEIKLYKNHKYLNWLIQKGPVV